MRGEVRAGRREMADDVRNSVQGGEGLTADSGAGHEEERTRNMRVMFVTLEVLKLSGWLNDAAPCRE